MTSIEWKIDRIVENGKLNTHKISIVPGDRIFLIGPNGSGKSTLMQQFYDMIYNESKKVDSPNHKIDVRNFTGHRPVTIPNNKSEIISSKLSDFETQIKNRDAQLINRFMDEQGFGGSYQTQNRNSLLVSEIIEAYHLHHKKIAEERFSEIGKDISVELVKLLGDGVLNLYFRLTDEFELEVKKNNSGWYSIQQLSDGERNAFILAANVIIAEPGAIFIIDEPEKHLYRSIIKPFLSNVFNSRPDCAFMISTHELSLPVMNPDSKIILTKKCHWARLDVNNPKTIPHSWEFDYFENESSFHEASDNLKTIMLGAKEKVLFVEGEGKNTSLDEPFYSALFPEVTIESMSSCNPVINYTRKMNLICSKNGYQMQAFGVIDGDNRSQVNIIDLSHDNIFVLECYSIESLFYCRISMEIYSSKLALNVDNTIKQIMNGMKNDNQGIENIAKNKLSKQYKDKDKGSISEKELIKEKQNIHDMLSKYEWDRFINSYKIRSSNFVREVEIAFGAKRSTLENILIDNIKNDMILRDWFRDKTGELSQKIA